MKSDIIKFVKNVGAAESKLRDLLLSDRLSDLSKHNPYYDSEHEIEADKLDDLRMSLSSISDVISDVLNLLEIEQDEGY